MFFHIKNLKIINYIYSFNFLVANNINQKQCQNEKKQEFNFLLNDNIISNFLIC